VNLFTREVNLWEVTNSKLEDIRSRTKIENGTQPKWILFANNTNMIETQAFILKRAYWVPAPHKYAVGSLKIWYCDDDFSDGSTLTLEIFLTPDSINTMEELEKPCFMMRIPSSQKQIQRHSEYIYFGESFTNTILFINVKISIYSYENNQLKPKSFGLRDLTIHLGNELVDVLYPQTRNDNLIYQDCSVNCEACFGPKPSQCLSCSPGSHWHGLECTNCHDNCDKCSGPTKNECLGCNVQLYDYRNGTCLEFCEWPFKQSGMSCLKACRSGEYALKFPAICSEGCPPSFISFTDNNGILVCENPCLEKNDFLYANGSCISVCPASFISEFRIEGKFCKNPCESTSDYLLTNGSCLRECLPPFQIRSEPGVKYCESPCDSKNLYHYNNGSCLSLCPEPLVAVLDQGILSCKNPCELASDYLYYNRSCLKECPAPLQIRSDSVANYCVNPCDSSDLYLYKNGSCLSNCIDPLIAETEYGVNFCKNPCESGSNYLYFNQSCLEECPAPLEIRSEPGVKYCENPCHSVNLYLYQNGSCLSTCKFPLVTVSENGITFCRNPCRLPSDYLYYNQECLKECPFPLEARSEPGVKYCENPCHSENLYLYNNGSCSTCKAPLVTALESGIRYCRNPCKSASDYLYANRSCLKECPAPLKVRSEPIAKFCVNPCAKSNLYLYENGSCFATCTFPLKIREEFGVKYCEPPCSLTGEYILRDGSCSKECPAPLIQRKDVSVGTFCLNPCPSNDHFLLRNESCRENCPVYFETEIQYGVKYCIPPCPDDHYFFPQNRSCLDTCPHPLMRTSEEGINSCQNPCSKLNSFLYDDQSCYEGCPAPLIIKEGNYCKSPCQKENEYVNANGICQQTCEHPDTILQKGPSKICMTGSKRARTQSAQFLAIKEIIKISNTLSELGGVLSCLINTGDPISILMIPLLEMFQKIIYTEIVLPKNTKLVLNQFSAGAPEQRVFSSSGRPKIVILAIFSVITLLIAGLLKLGRFSNESKFYQLLEKLDAALRWNLLIPLFISMNGDLLLHSLIKLQLSNPRSILFICLTIYIFYKIFSMSSRGETGSPRWKFLFEIFSENQRFFILVYFTRVIVYHLVIGLLNGYPSLQAFSMMLLSFGMCFYLIWTSPIKNALCKIQYLTVELALLSYNCIFGILAVFALKESSVTDVLGQLMNILYLITSVITVFIIAFKILHIIYRYSKAQSSLVHIQLSEMNQENDLGSPQASIRFEPLNQIEMNSEGENNLGKVF